MKASLKGDETATEHAAKTKHAHHVRRHRKHKVAEAGDDDAIDKAVAKKKSKAQTADSGENFFNLWR